MELTRLPLCSSCQCRHPYGMHDPELQRMWHAAYARHRALRGLPPLIESFSAQEHPIPSRRWPWRIDWTGPLTS